MIFDSIIETERLLLRCLDFCDAEYIFRVRSNPTSMMLGWEPFKSIDQVNDYIRLVRSDFLSYYFAVVPKTVENTVGNACLWGINYNKKTAELGYDVEAGHRGKGYASEACKAVINFAFDELGMETIKAFPRTGNKPSIALLEKLGFKCVETIKSTLKSGEEVEHYDFQINKA